MWRATWTLSERERPIVLVTLGAVSTAVYVSLTSAMSLDEFFPGPGKTLDFQFMLGEDWQANTVRLYGSFGALFLLWGGALVLVAGTRATRTMWAVVVLGALGFVAVLAPMYPPFAVDFFHYLGEGRVLWVEGENPLTAGPGRYFPIGMSYGGEPAAYGPLWYWLLGPPVLAGGDDFPRSLLLLKLWMAAWLAVSTLLAVLIARRLSPGRELLVAVAIAWNPFVAWRVLGNGHNDMVMMAFVLAAVWAAVSGRWRWLLPALAASILVKYVSLLLLPAFALFLWRRPRQELLAGRGELAQYRWQLAQGAVVAVWLVALAFLPLWEGVAVFDQVREQSGRLWTSTPRLISHFLEDGAGWERGAADELALRIGSVAFLVVAVLLLWRQRAGQVGLVAAAIGVLLAYSLLGIGWFRPWYFLWLVPLMAVLPGRWWLALLVVTSVAGLAPDVAEKYAVRIGLFSGVFFALPAILLQFVPPAAVWVAGLWRTRSTTLGAEESRAGPGVEPRGD